MYHPIKGPQILNSDGINENDIHKSECCKTQNKCQLWKFSVWLSSHFFST